MSNGKLILMLSVFLRRYNITWQYNMYQKKASKIS